MLGGLRRQLLEARAARGRPAGATSSGSASASSCSRSSLASAGGLVELAELLLDRLELLAQEVLALALVDLGLDLGLDLACRSRSPRARARGSPTRRRRRRATSTSSSSACFSSVGSRSEPAMRCAERATGRRCWRPRAAAPRAGRGPPRRSRVKVCLDVAHERRRARATRRDDVGQLLDLGDEVGLLARPSATIAHALARPGRGCAACRRAPSACARRRRRRRRRRGRRGRAPRARGCARRP